MNLKQSTVSGNTNTYMLGHRKLASPGHSSQNLCQVPEVALRRRSHFLSRHGSPSACCLCSKTQQRNDSILWNYSLLLFRYL
jgi:hypothetical protein